MNNKRTNTKRTARQAPPPKVKHQGVAELTDAELNHITGGAMQAYITVSGTKQGQAKGSG